MFNKGNYGKLYLLHYYPVAVIAQSELKIICFDELSINHEIVSTVFYYFMLINILSPEILWRYIFIGNEFRCVINSLWATQSISNEDLPFLLYYCS